MKASLANRPCAQKQTIDSTLSIEGWEKSVDGTRTDASLFTIGSLDLQVSITEIVGKWAQIKTNLSFFHDGNFVYSADFRGGVAVKKLEDEQILVRWHDADSWTETTLGPTTKWDVVCKRFYDRDVNF